MRTRSSLGWLCGGLLLVTHVASTQAASDADPFAGCLEQFARSQDDYDPAYCIYEVALQRRLQAEGARLFDALIDTHPHNQWLPLAYGHLHRTSDPDRAEALYRRAADGFRDAGHAEGELLARSNLRNFLFPRGRVDEASRQVERVVEIGEATDDPLLQARAWSLQALHVQDTGGDLGLAYRLLKQTEAAILPDGPYRLRRTTLNSLGLVAFRLGRFDEALALYQALDDLATAEGEALAQATARYNILNTLASKEMLLPTPGARQRLLRLAERALSAAIAGQNREVAMKSHRAMAELLASESDTWAEALTHVESCLALSESYADDEAACAWSHAMLLRARAPDEAMAARRRALDATARANSPRTDTYSAGRRMRFSWDVNPRPVAIRDSLAALDAIETLRSRQEEAGSSAGLFSTWTSDYYWLSGRLLESAGEGELELAFTIVERMRARSLLDSLDRSPAPPDAGSVPARARRDLLDAIAGVQRRLLNPALPDGERRTALDRLQTLEWQEREARRQIGLAVPAADGPVTTPRFATVDDVRSALGENEAMLSFQVGQWSTYDGSFGGGSWLTALTRHRQSSHRLLDRSQLVPMMPVFTGLVQREDGLEAASAARLYQELLAEALRQLPPGIERLILVPDGPLHHLPFDALRMGHDAASLVERYELVVVPSATLWLHWRQIGWQSATHRALAFADPQIDSPLASHAVERGGPLQEGLRLGRLPHARREGRALARHLGTVEVLVGAQASERTVKERHLRDYDILHFAAHAVADDVRPERSAVLLAAGAATEDGLLQAREIEELDLEGRIVVLSACQTAFGAVLSGEGVLSLARAFFQAGAHAVIGTRWPVRDEDAASLFDAFYYHLAKGASLSDALREAKLEMIAAGRPAAVWASLVLLGDGDIRPFAHGRGERAPAPASVFALAVALLTALAASRARAAI